MYWIMGALAFVGLFFVVRYYLTRREIKRVTRQLNELADNARYGKRLYLEEKDHRLSELLFEINRLVDDYEGKLHNAADLEHSIRLTISGISHDLRTPLTSLAGFMQLMKKASSEDKRQEYLNFALESVRVLQSFVERFYELSRLEIDDTHFALESLNLEHIICDCFLRFYEDFESKNIQLDIKDAKHPPLGMADPVALQRILGNLIQNLLRYAHGTVTVSFHDEDGFIVVKIGNRTDLPLPDNIDGLLDRFQTADQSRGSQGMGLGLYICRKLINGMGGSISAEKDGEMLYFKVKILSV